MKKYLINKIKSSKGGVIYYEEDDLVVDYNERQRVYSGGWNYILNNLKWIL